MKYFFTCVFNMVAIFISSVCNHIKPCTLLLINEESRDVHTFDEKKKKYFICLIY